MIDAEKITSRLVAKTEANDLFWDLTDAGDAFRTELAGVECIVWFNHELEMVVLTMRDDEYGTMEYGEEAEELRNTISRQMFYRSGAPERLFAALSAKSPRT